MKKNKLYTIALIACLIGATTSVVNGASSESITHWTDIKHGFQATAMSILIHQGTVAFNSQFAFEHEQDSLSRFICCVPASLCYAEVLKIGSGFFRTEELSLSQELLLRAGTLGAVLCYAHRIKPFFTPKETTQSYLLPLSKPPVADSALKVSITESTPCSFCRHPLLNENPAKQLLMQLPLCHCTVASFAHKICFLEADQKQHCATCTSDYYFPQQKTRHQLENGQWLINY